MVGLPRSRGEASLTVKRIVATIAANGVGSAVLGRNCVGVLVECPAFFDEQLSQLVSW